MNGIPEVDHLNHPTPVFEEYIYSQVIPCRFSLNKQTRLQMVHLG